MVDLCTIEPKFSQKSNYYGEFKELILSALDFWMLSSHINCSLVYMTSHLRLYNGNFIWHINDYTKFYSFLFIF